MAFQQLTPVTLNPTVTQGAAQAFQTTTIKDFSNTAVDLSAWTALTAKAVALSPGPNTADVTFGTVTGNASGIVTLQTSASDLASVNPGAAKLVITGKPTSGDAVQILCTGTLTVANG